MTVQAPARTTDEFVEACKKLYAYVYDRSTVAKNVGAAGTSYGMEYSGSVITAMRAVFPEYTYPTLRRFSRDAYAFLRETRAMRCVSRTGKERENPRWLLANYWPELNVNIKRMTTEYALPEADQVPKQTAPKAVRATGKAKRVTKRKTRKLPKPGTDLRAVYDALDGNGWTSSADIMVATGQNQSRASSNLVQLVNRKFVTSKVVRRGGGAGVRKLYCVTSQVPLEVADIPAPNLPHDVAQGMQQSAGVIRRAFGQPKTDYAGMSDEAIAVLAEAARRGLL